jgi:rod shape determining protein RodA
LAGELRLRRRRDRYATPLSTFDNGGMTLLQLDMLLVCAVVMIAIGGIISINSALHTHPDAGAFTHKQIAGLIIGIGLMAGIAATDYRTVWPRFSGWLYGINLLFLTIVIVGHLGHSSHGAMRWISIGPVQFQPSEFAKFAVTVALAVFVNSRRDSITKWGTVCESLGVIGLPLIFIFKQPDLGTALVVLTMWIGIMVVAGAQWKHVGLVLLAGALLFTGMWHFHVLKDYQKNRLVAFINPDADPRDTGYHLRQSQIAIGSGELTGQGYEQGGQATGKFIPEQHTDFIFTIVGEEGGFVASIFVLALYLFVLERGVAIIAECEDFLGRLLAAGVVSMLAFHVIINIGMTIGVMPVTGVPLPFFGLSSLLIDMASIGLLLSVSTQRHRSLFAA